MAGWGDITGATAGDLNTGCMLDTEFINTFIRAINERGYLCGFDNSTPGSVKGDLLEIPEDECLFNFRQLGDNGVPWNIQNGDYVSPLFYRIGRMMNKVWVHEEVWDDPLSYTSVTSDNTMFWSLQEISDLIGETYFDILRDPYANGYKLSDFQSAGIYNAIYQLLKEVFVYIDSRSIGPGLFSYAPIRFNQVDELLENVTQAAANTFNNVTVKNIYDTTGTNNDPPLFAPEQGKTEVGCEADAKYRYNAGPMDYNYEYEWNSQGSRTYPQQEFTMDSQNYEGDFIALERKEVTWVATNYIRDKAFPATTFNIYIADFPQVSTTPVKALMPALIDSTIEVDGWHFTTGVDKPDYLFESGNWVYSLIPGSVHTIEKRARFALRPDLPARDDADLYYNLNSDGMNYQAL